MRTLHMGEQERIRTWNGGIKDEAGEMVKDNKELTKKGTKSEMKTTSFAYY